jgi:mono/diheme cytochrome c family protein
MRFRVALAVLLGMTALGAGAGWAQAPQTQWDGVYSEEQSMRGAALYTQFCVSCHGEDLSGGGVESAPPLIGSKFSAKWDDLTIGNLLDQMVISMPQDAPGSVSRDQHVDILAFILAKNGFPAGKTDLASKAEVLSAIKIVAKKPG